MTMVRRDLPEIDRLIEDGLIRYGQGDLDGALSAWERALAIDPSNPAATSYVDYVRQNYEMLTAEANTADHAPFAIAEDEPEYQIEILPGEDVQATLSAPMYMDPLDEAWFIEEELIAPAAAAPMVAAAESREALSFEDQTREYAGQRLPRASSEALAEPVTTEYRTDDFLRPELTTAFGSPQDIATPNGFGAQSTEVRKRDLGFVKPRVTESPPSSGKLDSASAAYAAHVAGLELTTEPLDTAMTQDFGQRAIPLPPVVAAATPQPSEDPLISAPTRELGLRNPRPATEDEVTRPASPIEPHRPTTDVGDPEFDPLDLKAAAILDDIDAEAPIPEPPDEQIRRRITRLLERATDWVKADDLERAVLAVELALSEAPDSALAQKLIYRHRETFMGVFHAYLGDLNRQPALARPLHELSSAAINPRAAFLLSRVDGMLSVDEILDVSGMPRLEACRYLCQLMVRGILR